MVPLELSVKLTVSGLRPLVGLPLKLAPGATAPVPVSALVLLPSLAVLTTTTLLKVPALPGAKLRTRLVELKPLRLKGVPETMVNPGEPGLTIVSGTPFSLSGFSSTNLVLSFAPGSAGTFSNVVVVSTANDGSSTNALTGTGAVAPGASFSGSPTSGLKPLTVSFTDNSSGTITNRFWDFGDSSTTNTTA